MLTACARGYRQHLLHRDMHSSNFSPLWMRVPFSSGRPKAALTTAHLLRNHDNTSRPSRTPHPRNGEELKTTREDAAVDAQARLLDQHFLLLQQTVHVVQVTARLQRRVAQPQQRPPRLRVPALLHVPARRLRAEPDAENDGHSGDEGRAELQAPRDVARLADGEIGAGSQEDTYKNAPMWCKSEAARKRGEGERMMVLVRLREI